MNIVLENIPNQDRSIFVYKVINGIITDKIFVNSIVENVVQLGSDNRFTPVLIDYYYDEPQIQYHEIGGENIKGYFKMTSKINFVDEKDGNKETVLFIMPKVKILSNINLTFGVQANPIVSNFRIRALADNSKTLGRFIFLRTDIEG